MRKRADQRWLKIILGVLVTVITVWLSFRKLDWHTVKTAFFQVNLFWVFLAVANSLLTVYALGWRWRILLAPKVNISMGQLFKLNIISQYVNILMPARLGEVIRAYLTSKEHLISGAYVMGTILIEKIFDVFVYISLWIFIPFVFARNETFRGYNLSLVFCLLSLGFLAIFMLRPNLLLKGCKRFSILLPRKFRERFNNFFERSIEAFGSLKSVKTLLSLLSWTLVFLMGQTLTIYFLFKAFNFSLSFWAALFVLLVRQIGNIPPSTPGKVGIFEFAVILALSVFAVSKSQALSYAVILHAVAYLPKILLGLFFVTHMDIYPEKIYSDTDYENQQSL
jgi:uncharacterized protein (TIRG00374 family)